MGDRLLYLVSLATFTFGAFALSLLTLSYWRERWRPGPQRHGQTVFPVFTLLCAAAFVLNLLMQAVLLAGANQRVATVLMVARGLMVAILPPMMLHLVYETEARHLPVRRLWQWLLIAFYGIGIGSALLPGLAAIGFSPPDWASTFDPAPGVMLAAVAGAGLLLLSTVRRRPQAAERTHRRWMSGVLLVTFLCAAVNLWNPGPVVTLLPDYALLVFFSVNLYYRERLAFIDVLVKRGLFFAVGLGALLLLVVVTGLAAPLASSDSTEWLLALLLLPLWLVGPWIHKRVEVAVDRVWLRRPYSPADAERRFLHDIQAVASEEQLRERAASSLSSIFQAPAEVAFEPLVTHPNRTADGMAAELERDGAAMGSGWVRGPMGSRFSATIGG